MKYYLITILFLSFLSCNKDEIPGKDDNAPANTVIVQSDGQLYSLPITSQLLYLSSPSSLTLVAKSADLEVSLNAVSIADNSGSGSYFLSCCGNEVQEKYSGGQFYDGIPDGTVNATVAEKGKLTVTNTGMVGYSGTFSFEGKNASGQQKIFTGTFKVVY